MNNVAFLSAVPQRDSVIHIHVFALFQTFLAFRSSQNTEFPVLYRRFCWLSISCIVMGICQSQTPNLTLPSHLSPVVTIRLFSVSVSLFLLENHLFGNSKLFCVIL